MMNFFYEPTTGSPSVGLITISSSAEFSINQIFDKEFSWKVGGFLVKDQEFSWNVGEGEYYWYRVEGECQEVNCENFNVDYKKCQAMTFMTIVPARNLPEVCEIMNKPKLNPPVRVRVYSIQKYSRPIARTATSIIEDQCNILEDEFFCQIPECSNYCIDYQATSVSNLDMRAIEASYSMSASGQIILTGRSNNNRFFAFSSDSSIVVLTGLSDSSIKLNFYSLEGSVSLSGKSAIKSTHFNYDSTGSLNASGQSLVTTPYRFYAFRGSIYLVGSGLVFPIRLDEKIEVSGSSDVLLSKTFKSDGTIFVQGRLSEHSSSSYNYIGDGGINLSSVFGFNFRSFGVLVASSSLEMKCLSLKSDLSGVKLGPDLTVSDEVIIPTCGCGPMGLSLLVTTNLNNSAVFSNFLNRNGKTYDGKMYMKYKSFDDTWHGVQHFYGLGKNGSFENWTLFSILTCKKDFWQMSFVIDSQSEINLVRNQTKFILNIPSDLICADSNISTNIKFNIRSGEFQISSGTRIRVSSRKEKNDFVLPRRGLDVYVDGIFNDYVVYYDNLGLFRDSYWSNIPFEININPRSKSEMPTSDLQSIFK